MKLIVATQNLRIATARESISPRSDLFWVKRMKQIARNIREACCDVVCVQEALGHLQLQVLKYYLKDYRYISTLQGLTPSRVAIFYHNDFKLIRKQRRLLSKAESITKHARYAVTATLHIGRRYFDVSSVHLSPYSEKAFKEGVEKTFELKGIIAGDFNAEYKNFEDKTYFMRKTDNNIRETYITKGTIIDFVFAPFYYRMDTTQVKGDRYASDHLLVYAPIWIN